MSTLDDLRLEMNALWQAADREGTEAKDSFRAVDRLSALYRQLEPVERGMAEEIVAEWVVSGNGRLRYDARVLILNLRIASAVPALRALESQLASANTLEANDEKSTVDRVIQKLSGTEL